MPNYLFFPTAILLALAMVYVALDPNGQTLPKGPVSGGGQNLALVQVEGIQLNRFVSKNNDKVRLVKVDGIYVEEISSRRGGDNPADAQGVAHLRLATDLEKGFQMKPVKIIVTARAAPRNPSPMMRVNYSAGVGGNSGWQEYPLTDTFLDYAFTYTPPEAKDDLGVDFLGIWADPAGKGRAVQIRKIVFEATP